MASIKANEKATGKMIEAVGLVVSFLENNKKQAVARLFPTATDEYRQEWLDRSIYKFWNHLDKYNQERLVNMAIEHYS